MTIKLQRIRVATDRGVLNKMKRLLLILFFLINLINSLVGQIADNENDTIIKLTLNTSFLPGPYSIECYFQISKIRHDFTLIRKKIKSIVTYNKETNDYTFSKLVVMEDTFVNVDNKEILFNALSDLFNHSKDSLFSVKLKRSDWKAIKNMSTKGYNMGINEIVIDNFRQSQAKIILLNINNFCFNEIESKQIDGCPLTLKLIYYSQTHIDSLELKGYNCSGNEVGKKYYKQWLLFFSTLVNYQELNDILSLIGLKDFIYSKEILYRIILEYIYDIKHKCPPQEQPIEFFHYDTITHYAYIEDNLDSCTRGLVQIYEINEGGSFIYFMDTVDTGKPGFFIELQKDEYLIRFNGRKRIFFNKYYKNKKILDNK